MHCVTGDHCSVYSHLPMSKNSLFPLISRHKSLKRMLHGTNYLKNKPE
jgi:hypothetical protein